MVNSIRMIKEKMISTLMSRENSLIKCDTTEVKKVEN